MQNFDLNAEQAGEWFPFFGSKVKPNGNIEYLEPEPGAGKAQFRIADPEFQEEIQKLAGGEKHVEFIPNPAKMNNLERVEWREQTPDQRKKEQELLWDHVIMGWEDKAPFLNNDGSPIEQTSKNKVKLMGIPSFARYAVRCLQLIAGAAEQAKEDAVKNS